ncbi:MAG: hypothetical protein FJ098_09130, partial [Deltaproteobacteria bacterium]|nr:hypothetical protein [Deltaproteobacteria bacterium]
AGGRRPLALDAALATFRDRWKPAGLAEGAEALAAWARDAAEGLRPRVTDAQATFGAALEDGLRDAGLPLRGRWPEWMSGPFRIRARPEAGEAALEWGPGVDPLETVPLDVAAMVRRIPQLAAELRSRHAAELLPARLLRAWRMALASEGRSEGDVPLGELVPLVALLAQGPRFTERPGRATWTVPYDRVQLSYDLARLRVVEHDGWALRLRVATRDQTRGRGPLWLPDDAAGNGTLFATARFERRSS